MSLRWGDLNARARGLATHLVTRAQLDVLARAPDGAALAAELRRLGLPLEEQDVTPEAIDLAVRRAAGARLRLLARWCGARTAVTTVLLEDEDRRSLRAILRGAVQGVPAAARLSGLVPTLALPERALGELARQARPGGVATLLAAWGNPYGPALLPEASAAQPDLLRLELALNRRYAERALAAGRAAGRRALLARHVRQTIDLENASTALVLAAEGKDLTPKDAFLPGGDRVSIEAFEVAAAAGDGGLAGRRLAAAFAGTPLAVPFERHGGDPARLEDAVLRARIGELVRAARAAPLGPAPLLAYALRLRAQTIDLRRLVWGVALASPRGALAQELVTA